MQAAHAFWKKARAFSVNLKDRLTQPEYRWITYPLFIFLITRAFLFVGAYMAESAFPGATSEGVWHANPDNLWLDVWGRWDSGYYMDIAQKGYWGVEPGAQGPIAFFPFYPILIKVFTPFTNSVLTAGILVSNLSLLGALIFLYRLSALEFGDDAVAMRTVTYIAIFPTAFFFSAVYTESTFLLFSVGAMYFARRRLWMWAAFMGTLCAVTRVPGVLMWGVIGLEWLRSHGWSLGTMHCRKAWQNLWRALRTDWISWLSISFVPLGLISYVFYSLVWFDDPFSFLTIQQNWGHRIIGPPSVIVQTLQTIPFSELLSGAQVGWSDWLGLYDLLAGFVALIVSIVAWRRLGASYGLYGLLSALIPISSQVMSMNRLILVIYPLFMMLGLWGRNKLLDTTLKIGFSLFLGILTSVFVNWIFVA